VGAGTKFVQRGKGITTESGKTLWDLGRRKFGHNRQSKEAKTRRPQKKGLDEGKKSGQFFEKNQTKRGNMRNGVRLRVKGAGDPPSPKWRGSGKEICSLERDRRKSRLIVKKTREKYTEFTRKTNINGTSRRSTSE